MQRALSEQQLTAAGRGGAKREKLMGTLLDMIEYEPNEAALLALLLRRLRLRWWAWRLGHTSLAAVTVVGSVVHAVLIEGTMETVTKLLLSALVLAVTVKVLVDLRVWTTQTRRKTKA